MQVSTQNGKTFTLTRETAADRQLIDALDFERSICLVAVLRDSTRNGRGGHETTAAIIEVDRAGALALRADSLRQALRTIGRLVDLSLCEPAQHGSVGTTEQDAAANQALLNSIRRLSPGQHLVGNQVCVIHASFGVDVQAAGFAPGSELVRVYVNTDNPNTFCLHTFAAFLGIPEPLIKSAMQFVTVFKHGHQPFEVLPLVPGHSDSLHTCDHVTPKAFDEAAIVVQGGAA